MVQQIFKNLVVGLLVSLVALNLGISMGILSERGVFAGIISAGVIAIITSLFGGTRIQSSGTTAPMSAVCATLMGFAVTTIEQSHPEISPGHFVNMTLMITAGLTILLGVFRTGRLIKLIPPLVVSGFMTGIALIIWVIQIELLFGIDQEPLAGDMISNFSVALLTLCICIGAPKLLKRLWAPLADFIPAGLIAILLCSVCAYTMNLQIETLNFELPFKTFDTFQLYVADQIPTNWNWNIVFLAFPYALKLSVLCYIDTLLTSLIVDKMRGEETKRNKELIAQGVATGAVSLVGGIPGAQSTVPSVLIIKEGATMRLAGVAVGLFVLIELMLFSNLLSFIPQAVFIGILLKVGYDVCDIIPILLYFKNTVFAKGKKRVKNREMAIISGTALATAFVNLIVAVGFFTAIYMLLKSKFYKHREDKDKRSKV